MTPLIVPETPGSDFEADNDASESDAVVKAGAVVRRLRMDAHEDDDHESDNERIRPCARMHPLVHQWCIVKLDERNSSPEERPEDDVQEPMHAAIETPDNNGECIAVAERLGGHSGGGRECIAFATQAKDPV